MDDLCVDTMVELRGSLFVGGVGALVEEHKIIASSGLAVECDRARGENVVVSTKQAADKRLVRGFFASWCEAWCGS
jgi:hypothetical protein